MRGYREFLRAFDGYLRSTGSAGRPGGDVDEDSIAAERDTRAATDRYVPDLMADAGIAMLIVDTGFGGPDGLDPQTLGRLARRPVHTITRLEPLAERLLADWRGSLTPGRFRAAVASAIEAELDAGAVGLKTIAAYRSGLALAEPSAAAARRALADRERQARRLDDPALVSLVARTGAEIGRVRRVPLQVHVGFGDEDLELPAADPSLLGPLLRDQRIDGCPIVLLHGYPFVARAAYLASIYPDVHVDLSLTIPLLGAAGARAAISEALALCPETKLLAGTDGHSYPEMHWRGARLWRESLTAVLEDEVRADRMGAAEAASAARSILGGNARRLYPGAADLDPSAPGPSAPERRGA
jgi:uncharacterized protein